MKVFIKNTNPELSHLIIPVLEMLGGKNTSRYKGEGRNSVYYIRENYTIDIEPDKNTQGLTKGSYIEIDLQKLNNLFNPKPNNVFPKVMKVYDKDGITCKRIVIGRNPFNNKYIAINDALTIEEAKHNNFLGISTWEYAEDIVEEKPIIELSLQDIANKLNIPVEQIRIKD